MFLPRTKDFRPSAIYSPHAMEGYLFRTIRAQKNDVDHAVQTVYSTPVKTPRVAPIPWISRPPSGTVIRPPVIETKMLV